MESVTKETLIDAIIKNEIVLVDVYANWCTPCQRMMPLLEDISRDYQEKANLVKIELDTNKEYLQERFDVQKVPTFIIYKDGKEQKRFEGVTRMQVLRDTLDEAIEDENRI